MQVLKKACVVLQRLVVIPMSNSTTLNRCVKINKNVELCSLYIYGVLLFFYINLLFLKRIVFCIHLICFESLLVLLLLLLFTLCPSINVIFEIDNKFE